MILQCIGCGYCCMKARCSVSYYFLASDSKRCPALVFSMGRFWCSLASDPDVKKALYIGEGCSSTMFNTQREDFLRGDGAKYGQDND